MGNTPAVISKSEQVATPKQILTIVVEDYYQVGAFKRLIPTEYWQRFDSRLQHNLDLSLRLLEQTNSKATFFVCGWIADHHPDILQRILAHGHELACQTYYHQHIGPKPSKELLTDIARAKNAVEQATSIEVQGFRIANGWLEPNQLWLLDQLVNMGFSYDSSLCRVGRNFAAQPELGQIHTYQSRQGSLYEVPVSSAQFWHWSMPIAGGNYWRQFPVWPLEFLIKQWTDKHSQPLVSYFHLWELDPKQPRIAAASPVEKLRHYRNLTGMRDKLYHYLSQYSFTNIADYLQLPQTQISAQSASPLTSGESNSQSQASSTSHEKVDLTLVIPCYNEEQALPYLHKTLQAFADKAAEQLNLHYLFIDDGSVDGTRELWQQLFGHTANTLMLRHEKNRGIAAALVTGFEQVETELVAVLDADCTFAPEQLFNMLQLLDDGVDVVAASPLHAQGGMQNVNWWRQTMSKGAAFLHSLVLRHKLTSYTSCFRLYRSHTVKGLRLYHSGFCGVTEILARIDLAGYRIAEYPAILEVRLLGVSKINFFKTISEHLGLVAQLAACKWLGRPIPDRVVAEKQPGD